MLTFCFVLFFISLLFNLTAFIFSEKLLNYFTNKLNKYILLNLKFNKKVTGFEIIMVKSFNILLTVFCFIRTILYSNTYYYFVCFLFYFLCVCFCIWFN